MSYLTSAVCALTINTPDLEKSLAFYKTLGFKEVMRADWPFPWIQIADGVLLIMLRQENEPYMALTYYVQDIDNLISELKSHGIVFTSLPSKSDKLKRAVAESPDGFKVSFVATPGGFKQPKGKSMAQLNPEELANPAKYHNKVLGMFGELAQPVTDLTRSIEFWKALGFENVSVFDQPYPWAIATDGRMVVGLHQSSAFGAPAITYFAADMARRIDDLKKKGIQGLDDSVPGDTGITTPEGQKIFLHGLGMPETAEPTREFSVRAIASVRNTRTEPIDDHWGVIVSEIELDNEIPDEALLGIEDFSHLEIIYLFDKVEEDKIVLSGRPRGNPDYPVYGIFAQRKKDRPNRIGLCTVELVGRKGRVLTVRNLDAIDGTPVLDIKPVFREFKPGSEIRQPTWVSDLMKNYW